MKFCKHCGRELNEKERCSCPKSVTTKKKLLFAAIGAALIVLIVIAAVLVATIGADPANTPTTETSRETLLSTDTGSVEPSETEPSIESSETNTYTDADTDTADPESVDTDDPSDTTSEPVSETTVHDTKNEETTNTEPAILLDPFDYLIEGLVFDRYNGAGTVTVARNNDALLEALKPSLEDEDAYLEYIENRNEYKFAIQDIDIEITPNKDLSNGDEITVTVTVPEFLIDRVKNAAKTYTVDGLAEIQRIDILDMFTFSIKGSISGEADLVVTPKTEDAYLKDYWLQIEPQYDLSSGNEVAVTLPDDYIAHLLNDYGILPTRTVRVLTVPQLSEYVISADQLPKDTLLNLAQSFIEEEGSPVDEYGYSYTDATIYGCYFMNRKPDGLGYNNVLEMIIYYDRYYNGVYDSTWYDSIRFNRILQKPDGTVSIAYEDGQTKSFTNIENYISQYDSYYTVTRIELAE